MTQRRAGVRILEQGQPVVVVDRRLQLLGGKLATGAALHQLAQARAVEVHRRGERRIVGGQAELLVQRDQLRPARAGEILALEHAHRAVVRMVDLDDRLHAEQRALLVAAQLAVDERKLLVRAHLAARVGGVLEIGERQIGQRGKIFRRAKGALEREQRARMARLELEREAIALRAALGLAAPLESLADRHQQREA